MCLVLLIDDENPARGTPPPIVNTVGCENDFERTCVDATLAGGIPAMGIGRRAAGWEELHIAL